LTPSSLFPGELAARLESTGVFLETGAFITHIRTSIRSVAEGIALLYADHRLAVQNDFADFHVSLERPASVRRWFKPQVLFKFDGKSPFKPLPLEQAFPMLEWGLNWCVSSHANRYLIIHAAVIEKGGHAAILPAPPGSGKSTLCAALIHRGWRLLSDELALIRTSDGRIAPLARPVSLKNQSIDIIGNYVSDGIFSRPVTDTMKGTVAHLKPPVESVHRAAEFALPGWVIFPKWESGMPARLDELPRTRAFMRVAENAFNYSALGTRGFETLARVVDRSRCFEFTYSDLDDAVDIFASLQPATPIS
jgi:hypothetical protein